MADYKYLSNGAGRDWGFCVDCGKDISERHSRLTRFCNVCMSDPNHKSVHRIISDLRQQKAEVKEIEVKVVDLQDLVKHLKGCKLRITGSLPNLNVHIEEGPNGQK